METLSFLDLPVHDGKPVAKLVEAFINDNRELVTSLDVVVRVSIIKENTGRTGKEERYAQLKAIIKDNSELPTVWKGGKYTLDFGNLVFYRTDDRKKTEFHISAGETMALYQKLIKNQKPVSWTAYYANMRSRLGEDFLKGLV